MARITLNSISLDLPVYGSGTRGLKKEFIRLATGGFLANQEQKVITIRALDRLCLHLSDGERLGLIGLNGAGKTSCLRILAGIYEPTGGTLLVQGHITPLLEMMIGFDEASTGQEVITIRGLLQGLSLKEIKKKRQVIADFTELGDYLKLPIRTYSTGMKIRLAFGIATACKPEILLLDEIFGMGDASFMEKAKGKMRELIDTSSIVVLTSHNLELIQEICTHVLWLDGGKIRFFGMVTEGIEKYLTHIQSTTPH